MSAATDHLVTQLAAELRPVARLQPPLVRALGWLAAVAAVAAVLACVSNLAELGQRLRAMPDMWLAVLGSTATLVLAAVAAFELSLPDRRAAWALLPLPGLALWIGASGLGCLRDAPIPGMHAATADDAHVCFVFIVGLSLPLSALLVLMVRRACPLRPALTAAVAGLAAAAAAATLLNFFHPYDASATDLLVHAAAVALVVAGNRLLGGRLLDAGPARAPVASR